MVASTQVLDALRDIGLNLYERKLYVSLLSRGTATAGELSEMANVPRSRSYDVLESLAEKGFVVVQNAKPLKYVAIPPEEAFERSKEKMRTNLKNMEDRIEDIKTSKVMDEMKSLFSHGITLIQPSEITGSIKGRHSIHQQISLMIKNAKSHINIVTTPAGLNELMQHHYETLRLAKESGVKIRIAVPQDKTTIEATEAFKSLAEVRNLDAPQGRMMSSDSKETFFALTDDTSTHHTQDTAFWTSSEHAVKNVMEPFFDRLWSDLDKKKK
jgi:sugar-specific transcriptional regulator TrmB